MRKIAHTIKQAREPISVVLIGVVLLGTGFAGGRYWEPWTAEATPGGPLVCALAEDSQPVDCRTGQPLDYHDGGWWLPELSPRLGPTGFGCGGGCETPDAPAGQLDGRGEVRQS